MTKTILLSSLLALFATECPGDSEEPVLLRLDPPVGTTISLEAVLEQEITQDLGGVEGTVEQEITYAYTQKVVGLGDDGSVLLSMTYDSFKAVTESQMGRMVVDTSEPGPDPMSRAFAAAMGKSVTIRLAPDGDVLAIDGVDALVDALLEGLGGDEAAALRGAIQAQMGEDSIKRLVEPFLSIYPEGPVEVDDRWERRIVVDSALPHVQENTYELVSRRDGVARIEMTSKISPSESDEPIPMGPMVLHVSLRGEQEGHLLIEEASGLAIGMEFEQELEGEMRPVGDDGETVWPMKVSGRLQVKKRG